MKGKFIFGFLAVTLLVVAVTVSAEGWSGYNYDAGIFVGTFCQYYQQKYGWTQEKCDIQLGAAGNDQMVMKWNAEYDRGQAEGWLFPPYKAWYSIKYNGMFPGADGETLHIKKIWAGPGNKFENIMCHGTYENIHYWCGHDIPAGYGAY